jgi:hypothetical protein
MAIQGKIMLSLNKVSVAGICLAALLAGQLILAGCHSQKRDGKVSHKQIQNAIDQSCLTLRKLNLDACASTNGVEVSLQPTTRPDDWQSGEWICVAFPCGAECEIDTSGVLRRFTNHSSVNSHSVDCERAKIEAAKVMTNFFSEYVALSGPYLSKDCLSASYIKTNCNIAMIMERVVIGFDRDCKVDWIFNTIPEPLKRPAFTPKVTLEEAFAKAQLIAAKVPTSKYWKRHWDLTVPYKPVFNKDWVRFKQVIPNTKLAEFGVGIGGFRFFSKKPRWVYEVTCHFDATAPTERFALIYLDVWIDITTGEVIGGYL